MVHTEHPFRLAPSLLALSGGGGAFLSRGLHMTEQSTHKTVIFQSN
jgi:hypothetical protein